MQQMICYVVLLGFKARCTVRFRTLWPPNTCLVLRTAYIAPQNSLACTDIVTEDDGTDASFESYSFKLPAFSDARTFRLYGAVPNPRTNIIGISKIQFYVRERNK